MEDLTCVQCGNDISKLENYINGALCEQCRLERILDEQYEDEKNQTTK